MQAVLEDSTSKPESTAQPGGAAQPQGTAQPPSAAEPANGAGERVAAARAPLCRDQLATAGKPFKPRAAAERRTRSGSELPKSPLERDARWHWINFWAAWCVPCKEELPLLLSWRSALGERLRFTFVSLDDDERQLDAFLEQQPPDGLKSTYWLPDGAVRQAWLAALELEAEPELPLQLLIDPSGKLRCRVEGAVDADDLASLRRIVDG